MRDRGSVPGNCRYALLGTSVYIIEKGEGRSPNRSCKGDIGSRSVRADSRGPADGGCWYCIYDNGNIAGHGPGASVGIGHAEKVIYKRTGRCSGLSNHGHIIRDGGCDGLCRTAVDVVFKGVRLGAQETCECDSWIGLTNTEGHRSAYRGGRKRLYRHGTAYRYTHAAVYFRGEAVRDNGISDPRVNDLVVQIGSGLAGWI